MRSIKTAAWSLVAVVATAATGQGEWGAEVWSAARQGAADRLEQLIDTGPSGEAGALASVLESYERTLERREADRQTERASAIEELTKELDSAAGARSLALNRALRAATALQMMQPDPVAALRDPLIARAVREAEAEARACEQRGEWVIASELFFRLNAMHEESQQYLPALERLGQRLQIVRNYAPEKYWSMRNDRRLAEELDALPPYNPTGDSYRDRLRGVDHVLTSRAIVRAQQRHVDSPSVASLLAGGFDGVTTLLSTDDVWETFPGLADGAARGQLADQIAALRERYEHAPAGGRLVDVAEAIADLLIANRATSKLPEEVLLHEFGNGALGVLDEYSQVIWPDDVESFQRSTSGSFVGIGVQISLDAMNQLTIVTPLAGTPAQRAGLRANDVIAKVDGVPTVGFTLDQAVNVITGERGTKVVLTIERSRGEGEAREVEAFDVSLVRDRIALESVRGWKRTGSGPQQWDWFVDDERRIGYIAISQFQDGTTRDFRRAVRQMQRDGLHGLILDLRFNPGGLLDEAVSLVSQFVEGVPVVTVEAADGHQVAVERAYTGEAILKSTPVVVLINEGSASASEIVAGALQDYAQRGLVDVVLVGQRSFGKGSVQNVWELLGARADGRMTLLKLTTQYYKLPGGRLIHRSRHSLPEKGVKPDLTVEMLPDQILKSAEIRRNADVVLLDEAGRIIDQDPEIPSDPEALLAEGIDVQLHTALLLLQSRAQGSATVARRPGVTEMEPVR